MREELEKLIESCAARGKHFLSIFSSSEVGVACVPYYTQHTPIVFFKSHTHEALYFLKTHYFIFSY